MLILTKVVGIDLVLRMFTYGRVLVLSCPIAAPAKPKSQMSSETVTHWRESGVLTQRPIDDGWLRGCRKRCRNPALHVGRPHTRAGSTNPPRGTKSTTPAPLHVLDKAGLRAEPGRNLRPCHLCRSRRGGCAERESKCSGGQNAYHHWSHNHSCKCCEFHRRIMNPETVCSRCIHWPRRRLPRIVALALFLPLYALAC